MEENTNLNISENKPAAKGGSDTKQIAGAILLAGIIIAGAILLKGNMPARVVTDTNNEAPITAPAKVSAEDRTLGDSNAKVTLVMYEDFQCPWCGKFVKESEEVIRNTYVKNGSVQLVYRDFSFLGDEAKRLGLEDESGKAAEAARCAGDQGKFWEYHDYLYDHQNGENQGSFSTVNLKSFAVNLGLDATNFNQCLDSDKYAEAVANSKIEGANAGVRGTPKGFILKNGKVVDTIDGYMQASAVTAKIDAALK